MKNNANKPTGCIYLVVTEHAYDIDTHIYIKAFTKLENAKLYFQKAVCAEKETPWIKDRDDVIIEDSETSFTAYIEGKYSETHTNIYLDLAITYD